MFHHNIAKCEPIFIFPTKVMIKH